MNSWLFKLYFTLTQALLCVYTMHPVITDVKKLHLLNNLIPPHAAWGWHSLSTHNTDQPVKLQFSRSCTTIDIIHSQMKPTQCLSRIGFIWVLLQVSLWKAKIKALSVTLLWDFVVTPVSASNTLFAMSTTSWRSSPWNSSNKQLPSMWCLCNCCRLLFVWKMWTLLIFLEVRGPVT